MTSLPEVLSGLTAHYADAARELGLGLRVDATFLDRACSGPLVFEVLGAGQDVDPDELDLDNLDEDEDDDVPRPRVRDVIDQIPPGTAVEWILAADGTGELHWVARPAADAGFHRLGAFTVGRRSSTPPPIVALTDRVAENDPGEIERLLGERGHTRGFTEKQIAAAEKRRGVAFPPELRLFFSLVKEGPVLGATDKRGPYAEVRDGLLAGTGKVGNVVDARRRWGRTAALPTMPAATARDVVQPAYASPHWVVFADDGGGNAYALDLAPGPKGAIGQVVQFDHELDDPPGLVAGSLTDFLRGRLRRPKPWGPPADAGTTIIHNDRGPGHRLTAANALTATELWVDRAEAHPIDLGLLRGSRTLTTLKFDQYATHPTYDLSALPTLTALTDLAAPEAVWAQIVAQDAYPPRLVTATFTESREVSLARALEVANAVLAHYGQPGLTLERAPIGG